MAVVRRKQLAAAAGAAAACAAAGATDVTAASTAETSPASSAAVAVASETSRASSSSNSSSSWSSNSSSSIYGIACMAVLAAISATLLRHFPSVLSADGRRLATAALLRIGNGELFMVACGVLFFVTCIATIAYNAHVAHNIRLERFVVALVSQQRKQQQHVGEGFEQPQEERPAEPHQLHGEEAECSNEGECCCDAQQDKIGVLFVIAHPDDESMFFAPTLSLFAANKERFEVFVLCLSTGDYLGQGATRAAELSAAAEAFGVESSHFVCLDEESLRDGWGDWPEEDIKEHVQTFLELHKHVQLVFTFDANGASGHPNHVSVFKGVKQLYNETIENCRRESQALQCQLQQSQQQQPQQKEELQQKEEQQQQLQQQEAKQQRVVPLLPRVFFFCLQTHGLLRKYAGLLNIIPATIDANNHGVDVATCLTPLASLKGMLAHWSQLVWFRWLFVFFSSYSYTNVFAPME